MEFSITADNKSFMSNESDSKDLCLLIQHYAEKVEKSVGSMFKVLTKFDKAQIVKLHNEKNCVSYQRFKTSMNDDSENTESVAAVIALGVPRTLLLKTVKGKKVTHHIPLHSGSLSVMSGITQDKYPKRQK